MDGTTKMPASQIAAIIDRLMAKRFATNYGWGFDGRFLSQYVGKRHIASRDRSQPILRGHFSKMQDLWSTPEWLPGLQILPAIIEVHCPFCDCRHRHGWPETFLTGQFMQYRGTHCGDYKGQRVRETGYWIAPFRQKDSGYMQHTLNPGVVLARKAVA